MNMKYKNVVIESYATYLPDNILTSAAIEDKLAPLYRKLSLPMGRLELMSGIKERRYWDVGTRPSTLATKAASSLFERSKIDKDQIDMLIFSSVCRDYLEPATASYVHKNLNLPDTCPFFDITNACMGMLNAFIVISEMIERGTLKAGLVVAGENGGPLLFQTINTLLKTPNLSRKEVKKYFANLTIGAGACAFLLTHRDISPHSPRLMGGVQCSDSHSNHLCQGNGDNHVLMMETDSEALMQKGVALTKKTWEMYKKKFSSNPDWVLCHQVGRIHIQAVLDALSLNLKKSFTTYETLGNTGSAALPITLANLGDSSKVAKDDSLLLLGIGSGLNCTMLEVLW